MLNRPINRWWNVLAGAMGCAAGAGVVATYVFGIFIKAISNEYAWDRSATTASISCFYLVSGIGSVVLGSVTARRSLRWTTFTWVLLFALSVASIAILPPSLPLFCLMFGVMGFFGAAATAMPYAVAIAGWFDRNRGLALAIAVSGTGIAGAVMSRYADWLMRNFGWRGGYVGVALFVGIVGAAALLFFFREPPHPAAGDPRAEPGPSLIELFTRPGVFWIISLPIFLVSFALIGTITNLAPILTDRGMSGPAAAGVLGLLGGASWFSRIGLGLLLDRVHVRYIAGVIFLMVAVGCSALAAGASGGLLIVAAVMVGLGIGAETDLLTYTTSRYFPASALSRALGGSWIFFAWGGALGVFAGSASFDLTGSYATALVTYALFALVATAVILLLGPYRYAAHSADEALGVPTDLVTAS